MVADNSFMISLILLLPLLGFVLIGLFNTRLSKKVVSVIACSTVVSAFIASVLLYLRLRAHPGSVITFTAFDWITSGSFTASFSFLVDPLSVLMLLIITGVGSLIHIYSIGYMHDDDAFNRFFAYLNLFVFFMLVLVLGSNYLLMFVGWEGVGLSSYLLIGFWYKNPDYNNAARKAFVMNRIGDLGLVLGIILIFIQFGSITYTDVFTQASSFAVNTPIITTITILLFIGAVGKSAQIPLHTWLPDAMAGPTPVSALIHAATMVTAGIYLVARNNLLFTLAPFTSDVITVIGLATSLLAAIIAVMQNDIKKVLAYSTVSQLGLIFAALGVHAYTAGIFHMTTHAFFKALLFLGAGSVIHGMNGEQDIRKMGGLGRYLPVTRWTFLVGTLAISGIPPFAGFFSKDEILAGAFASNPVIWAVAVAASLLTVFYMFRLYFLTFAGSSRTSQDTLHHIHESPVSMALPLIVLAILSLTGGFMGVAEVFGGSHPLGHFLTPVFANIQSLLPEHHLSISSEITLMVVMLTLTAVVLIAAFQIYVKRKNVPAADSTKLTGVQNLIYRKFYVDELYNALITTPLVKVSGWLYRVVDTQFIDRIVNGTGKMIQGSSRVVRLIQSGNTGFYIFIMVISIVVILVAQTFIL